MRKRNVVSVTPRTAASQAAMMQSLGNAASLTHLLRELLWDAMGDGDKDSRVAAAYRLAGQVGVILDRQCKALGATTTVDSPESWLGTDVA